MAFPLEALPKDHFQGLGHLSTDEPDSLRNLLNLMRGASNFSGYQVDPDDPTNFATPNAAYAAADAELPPEAPIVISVAPGKTHALSADLSVNPLRHCFIVSNEQMEDGQGADIGTKVTGNFILPSADAASSRRSFGVQGVQLIGDVTGDSNWKIMLSRTNHQGVITRTHGTNGCRLELVGQTGRAHPSYDFSLVDTDAPPSAANGSIKIRDSYLFTSLGAGESMFSLQDGLTFDIQDSVFDQFVLGTGTAMIDFGAGGNPANLKMRSVEITLTIASGSYAVLKNHAAIDTWWNATEVDASANPSLGVPIDLGGSVGGHYGSPRFVSSKSIAPTNPVIATVWEDLALGDVLTWDGAYWGNHGIYRKDVLVDIDTAALDHDVGFDVPTSAAVVSASLKLLKALTGGGGAVQVGLGTGSGGDSDKYAETASLAADQKDQNLHGTFNDGGGDDLKITAETAPGTSGGTVAGSNDEDARVVVYFKLPKTLP